jgi:dienelactone hydrolase
MSRQLLQAPTNRRVPGDSQVASRGSSGHGTVAVSVVAVQGTAVAVLLGQHGDWLGRAGRIVLVAVVAGFAVLVFRRGSGRLAGALGYLLGVVGVSVGIGIGVMHLLKSGPLSSTVAGLVCLVTGGVLLLTGAYHLVRRVRGWLRPVAVVAAAVTAFVLVFPSWQALYATDVPRPALGAVTPADVGLAYRDVSFSTPDRVTLSGWYIRSGNGAAVVMLHGASSTRSAVLKQAAALAHHGYGVLLFDARGHGRSGGDAMDFGWYGDEDIAGAVSWLRSQPDVDGRRIGAVGMSMGGEEAIGAAAGNDQIQAVVAEGATGRTAADLEWLSDEYGIRGAVTEAWDAVLEYDLADLLTSAEPPVSLHDAVARAAPRQVLLITAGTVDEETAAARYIRAASPHTVHIWKVPDAGHIQGISVQPGQWRRHVLGFLDSQLSHS